MAAANYFLVQNRGLEYYWINFICQIASYSAKVTLKVLTPPNGGDGSTFLKINFLKIPMVLIFFLNQTMRLSGCLDKKIKVIGLLENFLDDFEKKIGNF